MTGTAMTEAEEFHKIYKLEVVAIPTHRPMIRDDEADLVYRNEKGKFNALIDEIEEMQEAGRPVLVGTVSVEKSEKLGEMLEAARDQARSPERQVPREGGRDRRPGRPDRRGHDRHEHGRPRHGHPARRQPGRPGHPRSCIASGLNPAEVDKATYDAALAEAKAICDEDHERVVAAGGLHIIGTERHESRRIDNQLRGRAGRQGDPGSSRFYLSLDDDLMKRFASERVAGLMERMGLDEDVAIESRLVSKTIESAQSRVEGFNFDIRKRVVEFDDVINKQRETIYAERDKVLRNEDLGETIVGFLDEELDALVDQYLAAADRRRLEPRRSRAPPSGRWASRATGITEDELWEVGGARGDRASTSASWSTRQARRRRSARSARPTGRSSSDSSCCARSTRCGSST